MDIIISIELSCFHSSWLEPAASLLKWNNKWNGKDDGDDCLSPANVTWVCLCGFIWLRLFWLKMQLEQFSFRGQWYIINIIIVSVINL